MGQKFTPAYFQIKQDIKDKIGNGILRAGDLLPGRNTLCQEYNCSWSTLNRAINELILEGVLTAQKGKGTFVAQTITSNNMADQLPVKVWVCHPFSSVYAALSELMDGLREEVYRRGRVIQFIDNGFQESYPPDLNGFIVVTPSVNQLEFLIHAWDEGQRFVVLNSDFKDCPFVCVNSDIYTASIETIQYLIDNGHQNIGLLGLREGFSNYDHRKDAFIKGFQENGIVYSEDWFVGRPECRLDAKDLFGDWIDRHPKCTAIFTADYTSSHVMLEVLAEKGIHIPKDLSFVASGNIPFESMLKVSISTLLQPLKQLGSLAISILLNEEWDRGRVLIPCQLVIKDSIGELEISN
ncbi:substrate-binding domain-containing protein [Pullulanibacillus sp. KACC 23026]|uniref:GntR family transcriptional regulator n=1 Tax=Pullulanibacillus sp. KACC 23026 TaxID=3028315 RepID=UPI0023AFAB53|nr:substrate-binding domain-containing protein [Pullulanibacillus sp. KACC 23026]WEG11209.1 substrate-binding domain-containing protein [Pullulanibacillus sp. KACC 23026]